MIRGPHSYQFREGDDQQWLSCFGAGTTHTVVGSSNKTVVMSRDGWRRNQTGIPVSLSWSTTDPFAVVLLLHDDEITSWTFSRELLAEGGGLGDVRVRHGLVTSVELDSRNLRITLRLSVTWVEDFLRHTQDAMPLGTEPSLSEIGEPAWSTELARLSDWPG
ncbi:MAG TPA: SsgA family sporulation/cell division regulator [Umezawaea sp.]|nr:SsgA family sporulation/cell division regulator [Umezawaea sp.]